MDDIFVLAPALTLADERTITLVRGKPPTSPETILPTPWAFSYLLVGVILFCGSRLSTASIPSNVSRQATRASVTPVIQICLLIMLPQSGKVKKEKNSVAEEAAGIVTRCSCRSAKFQPCHFTNSLIPIPSNTTSNGAGTSLIHPPFLSTRLPQKK